MANQDVIDKGVAAQSLMESEIYKVATKELRDTIYKGWMDAKAEDNAKRENLFFLNRAVIGIEAQLAAMASNGRIEQEIAERQQKQVAVTDEVIDE